MEAAIWVVSIIVSVLVLSFFFAARQAIWPRKDDNTGSDALLMWRSTFPYNYNKEN